GSTIESVHYQVDLDTELAVRGVVPIVDQAGIPGPFPAPSLGVEDCRLFRWRDGWHVSASTRSANPDAVAQIVLLRLKEGSFRQAQFLSDSATHRDEKNWMPVVQDDVLRFVYSCSPTVVLRFDEREGGIFEELQHPGPQMLAHARGGTPLLPIAGGYLTLIHETTYNDQRLPSYLHRWLFFDPAFRVTRISPPFYFIF